MIEDIQKLLAKHNFWLYDMTYAIDIGKTGESKYFRVFTNSAYTYDTSNGILPSDIYLAISLASDILKNRYNNTNDIINGFETWLKSDEAKKLRKQIKESSEKLNKSIANSLKVPEKLLKSRINV